MEHPLSLNLVRQICFRALGVLLVFVLAFVLVKGLLPPPWHYPLGFLAFGIVLLTFRSVTPSTSSEWGSHPAHSSQPNRRKPK